MFVKHSNSRKELRMPHHTILIIDDTPDHRAVLARLLHAAGFRIIEAEPGDEALSCARRERPDLILSALSLPGQPGWETTRRLRTEPALAHTPILGATLYSPLLPWPWMRRAGYSDVVEKPYDIDELLQRIGQLLPELPYLPLAA